MQSIASAIDKEWEKEKYPMSPEELEKKWQNYYSQACSDENLATLLTEDDVEIIKKYTLNHYVLENTSVITKNLQEDTKLALKALRIK